MSAADRPDIYAYTAFRQYLSDWFDWKKAGGSRFSHRIFAKRLGSSDPSVLSNIIRGHRKLAETRIPLFAKAMELDEEETEYFTLLVRLGQAGPGEEHERAWGALTEFRFRQQGPSVDLDQLKFVSSVHFSAIRTLAECSGFQGDPVWIANQLRPRLDPDTVVEALDMLERLGWLHREAGSFVPATPTIQSAEQVDALGSYAYHRDALRHVGRVMDDLHQPEVAEQVGLFGFTMAVPESRIKDVRRMLWEVLSQTVHRVDRWEEERDRVVHVSMQLFPISEVISDE
ncbi:MAG: TIGR02147 family protein [Myxococcota bacterium]